MIRENEREPPRKHSVIKIEHGPGALTYPVKWLRRG